MSVYNILTTHIQCPICKITSVMDIEIFFGYKGLLSYHIGDKVQWHIGKSVKNGGRPKDGNIDVEGYTECPNCYKDFFVTIHVISDIVTAVTANVEKQGFKTKP